MTVSCNLLTSSIRHGLLRVKQAHNFPKTVSHNSKKVVGFWNMFQNPKQSHASHDLTKLHATIVSLKALSGAKNVVQAFCDPSKVPKIYSIRNRKRTFRNKGFILSRKFTSLAPELLSGTASTPKCYFLMFSSLSGNRTRDFDPKAVRRVSPDLSVIWESPSRGWFLS